ncbi:hypothetical protein [Mycobacterium gordonae]|uniref:hypothetical protein n=1 Tax=Mycobacterium gordonae TaxID=1778 RepID=UPI0012EAB694|nr:hypothetical protein [Mycobacterium gordonae]
MAHCGLLAGDAIRVARLVNVTLTDGGIGDPHAPRQAATELGDYLAQAVTNRRADRLPGLLTS